MAYKPHAQSRDPAQLRAVVYALRFGPFNTSDKTVARFRDQLKGFKDSRKTLKRFVLVSELGDLQGDDAELGRRAAQEYGVLFDGPQPPAPRLYLHLDPEYDGPLEQ